MKLRVYVVDDDAGICRLVNLVFTAAGIETLTEVNSRKAADRLNREKFDAVFLDLRMPAPDGFVLARKVRSGGFNQRSPIVLITGDDDPKVLRQGYEAGGNFFLFKPFDRGGLLRMVRASQEFIEREKRRFQRIAMSMPATLVAKDRRIEAMTLDVSLNGMLVEAAPTIPAGTPVEISFTPPDARRPLKIQASILRVIGQNRMALVYHSISPADNDTLHEFLLPLILTQLSAAG